MATFRLWVLGMKIWILLGEVPVSFLHSPYPGPGQPYQGPQSGLFECQLDTLSSERGRHAGRDVDVLLHGGRLGSGVAGATT